MMPSMWCVIVKNLPLGVTPSALQRACEEALNERPVWPQLPKIYDDEALVYLQAGDLQSKLCSTTVKLRVGGIIVSVKKAKLDEAKQWIEDRKPERKKNPAPSSNIRAYVKQQKREQRKINQQRHKDHNQQRQQALSASSAPGFGARKGIRSIKSSKKKNKIWNAESIEDDLAKRRAEPPTLRQMKAQLEPLKKGQHPKNMNKMTQKALFDILPEFGQHSNNNIIWYQYLIFVRQEPFYVTYPATWSWDIEGQWLKFKEEYSLNQSEAEKNHSKFKIGELNSTHSSHAMIGDLLNMKVTDKLSGKEYELKRTNLLIGKLINYGQIEFIRYFDPKDKENREIFLYDRKTGYHSSIECEDDIKIGEQVVFEAWWNKDDNDELIFDFRNTIINIQQEMFQNNHNYKIHADMVAFNIRYANSEDVEDLTGHNRVNQYSYADNKHDDDDDGLNDLGQQLNPLMPSNMYQVADLSKTDPLAADDFAGQRFEGLLITLRPDDTGLIVCFPYKENPNQDLTLLFHTRFVKTEQDKQALSVNMNLEFNIGVNPQNFGQGLYGFVATDIVISKRAFSNNIPFPVTLEKIDRPFKGQILIAPVMEHCGWIYNAKDNNMCQLQIAQKEQVHDYRVGMHVRYNELKQEIEQNNDDDDDDRKDDPRQQRPRRPQRHIYDMIAFEVLPVEKIENVAQYLRADNYVKYKAKKYISQRKLKMDEDRNIEFKYIAVDDKDNDSKYYSDLFLIVDSAEHYLNAFLNTCGGAIFFGIADDGTVIGQELMTRNKRDYIRNAIGQRLSHFKPSVPSEYYSVEFKEIVDIDGYVVPDTYVIVAQVAKLFDGDNIQQHVQFLTAQNGIYERRVTSVGGASKCKELTHLTPEQHRILYNQRNEKGITTEVHFGIKPKFEVFEDIDGKSSENNSNSDQSDDDQDDNKEDHNDNDSDTTQPQIALPDNKRQHNISGAEDEGKLPSSEMSNQSGNNLYSPNAALQNQQNQDNISGLSQSFNQMNFAMAAQANNRNNFNQFQINNNNNIYGVQQQQPQQPIQPNMTNVPRPLQYTTPQLNSLRLPDDTDQGRHILAQRVQTKLNAMMMITDYIVDPQWNSILTMSANPMYAAQKTTWKLLKQLEQKKVRERSLGRAKIIQQRQLVAAQKEQQRQQRQIQQQQAQLIQHQQMLEMQRQAQIYSDANLINISAAPRSQPDAAPLSQPNAASPSAMMNQDIPIQQPSNPNNQNDANVNVNDLSIGEQFAKNFGGSEPALDKHGYPILPDKSKYKAVAMEYCQKMGWKRPVEAAQMYGSGYRATVTFGKPGREKSESGDGLKQKSAIYEAYLKLIPKVIPKSSAIELMVKWVPGYKKQEKVSTATTGQQGQSIMKHPKSVLLEWAQKNSIAPPKTTFSEYADSTRNLRIWTAKVVFCGKTIEAKGGKKKDAESKCFQELLKHVMSGGISTQ